MKPHPGLLAALYIAVVSSLTAQSTFTDALTGWSRDNWIPQMQNRGLLYFPDPSTSPQGLIFMNYGAPTTASDTGLMTLKPEIFSASAAANWSAQVDVNLSVISPVQGLLLPGQYVNLNLIVSKANDPTNYNASLAITRYNNGSEIVHGFDAYLQTAGSNHPVLPTTVNTTDLATFRFSYDPITRNLAYGYDANGPVGGSGFTTLTTQSLAGWNLGGSDAFLFTLAGSSGAASGSGPDFSTLAPGYFQNCSVTGVSAVPEPSTYAAIFGFCTLAFTAWHRRIRR